MRCVIVHYHELALKGRNRPYFEGRLVRHIRLALKGLGIARVEPLQGRIRVMLKDEARWEPIKERLARVFGIANFSLNHGVSVDLNKPDLESLKAAAGEVIRDAPFSTFRVSTRRADKRFPFTSMDVDRAIGAHIGALTGKKVDLTDPDLTIHIEMMARHSYVAAGKVQGPGGMPTGVSGKVACLLSGGIDSPVAAYRMLKRGCKATFVHFHGRPFVTRASEEKVREIAELLTRYQLYSRLYLVPFGEIQRQIVLGAPAPFRVVLYRRMMIRIAEELARREKCWALVTGDSLGQVASQTPENLSVVEEAAQLPILRPLIGMDKIEITDQAQRIGTFETSIEPDQDCCKLFVPPHPSTKTSLDHIRKVERGIEIDMLVKQGLERTELAEFVYP
ncbi:MAG: tRNA 4-thiouridine(8) synthase ThiI [Nitrospirae bacterium]|nr:tRNA 4-thiouridine(8) synthase ThiI [Nitrospirota bacterium]